MNGSLRGNGSIVTQFQYSEKDAKGKIKEFDEGLITV